MIESMKEKTRRLERIIKGKNAGKTDTFVFSEVRKMIELAIAEEREAAARICERIPRTGWKIGEESWAKESVALIRQRAAPKDEVSE